MAKELQTLNTALLGLGGVGSSLLHQVLECRRLHANRYGLEFRIRAVADSSGVLLAKELTDEVLRKVLSAKAAGQSLDEQDDPNNELSSPEALLREVRSDWLLADCTASQAVTDLLLQAVARRAKVALANKKPLTSDWEAFQRLTSDPARCRWEATVGAGLPVIATLSRLIASGDPVSRVEGTLSGTLSYLMSELTGGESFSAVMDTARTRGYTEPDPRDDLGGKDVARKALILSRMLGNRLELEDVQVESLYPPEMAKLGVDEFMQGLEELDEAFEARIRSASAKGSVLRYTARVRDGECRVGLQECRADSPLGRLRGNDNLVEFHSRWYRPNPLVIQGRGAGAAATAAGVLSDLVELAFSR